MKSQIVIQTTWEYPSCPVTYFRLLNRHMLECDFGGEKIRGPRRVAYTAKRTAVRKFLQTPPRTEMEVVYGLEHGIEATATSWRSGQMAKIGCMVFRGPEYRKLRKWALAK